MKPDNRRQFMNDPRSRIGMLMRGKTLYQGGSPNPTGKNQFNPKLAAQNRIRKMKRNGYK